MVIIKIKKNHLEQLCLLFKNFLKKILIILIFFFEGHPFGKTIACKSQTFFLYIV